GPLVEERRLDAEELAVNPDVAEARARRLPEVVEVIERDEDAVLRPRALIVSHLVAADPGDADGARRNGGEVAEHERDPAAGEAAQLREAGRRRTGQASGPGRRGGCDRQRHRPRRWARPNRRRSNHRGWGRERPAHPGRAVRRWRRRRG